MGGTVSKRETCAFTGAKGCGGNWGRHFGASKGQKGISFAIITFRFLFMVTVGQKRCAKIMALWERSLPLIVN